MKPGLAARVAAATMLRRVTNEGAYSNRVVDAEAGDLEHRDRRFAQHLLYTSLRLLPRIDRAIETVAGRSVDDLDPPVRAVLRIGAGELLASGEPHSAVDLAVDAARKLGAGRASGFVNAALRRLAREGEPALPEGVAGNALACGIPEWMYRRLSEAFGEAEVLATMEALHDDPGIGLVLRRHRPQIEMSPVPGLPSWTGYVQPGPHVFDAIDSGDALAIDPASAAVALALAPQPGERVIDLAAAPGGKTVLLADAMEGAGLLVAADRHRRRVQRTRARLGRLGVAVPWIVMDAARPALRRQTFDAVLLDAPCTGLGTLRRRPEIGHRIQPEAPARLATRQRVMLEAALELVAPGGRLVYSVCTLFPEETIEIVASLPARAPEGIPGTQWGRGLLLAPHLTGTDGMFIAEIRP